MIRVQLMLPFLDIPRRRLICSKGQEPLLPGTVCHTLLLETPQGWIREDLCKKCSLELKPDLLPHPVKSTWKSQVPLKNALTELPKQRDERALALLKAAIREDDPGDREEAFILALYLMRKKLLYFRQEIDQLGEKVLLYETAATEEIIPVKKPDKVAVEQVRERLATKFKIETTHISA